MLQGWGGGGGEVVAKFLALGFAVLQYFEHMLRFIDSLLCALQDKVNIMGYGAVLVICDVLQNCGQDGGHLGFDSNFKFIEKLEKSNISSARVEKYDTVKHFPALFNLHLYLKVA